MATKTLFNWKESGRLNWKEGAGLITPALDASFRAAIVRLAKAVSAKSAPSIVQPTQHPPK